MQSMMCGATESGNHQTKCVQVIINKTPPRSNLGNRDNFRITSYLGSHQKHNAQSQDKRRGKKKNKDTKRLFTQFGPNLTYSGGEIVLSNPLSKSFYKRDTKCYKKLALTMYKTKREQMNQQNGSLKHLKRSAPEVMTSSEARSPEAEVH
ncbi:hypothetical protein MTR_7g067825 [Medicago truncatula]|uniref:Uncharacterized protein n=1 Tax=Medicago truncatula TaxID=3880 RepID=A0A072U1U7_MEDTR|nr:hypothetical protein MTR_7g067825 [Medicago truncatula]